MAEIIFQRCTPADLLRAIDPWIATEPAAYALLAAAAMPPSQTPDAPGTGLASPADPVIAPPAAPIGWCAVVTRDDVPILALTQSPPWPMLLIGPLPIRPADPVIAGVLADGIRRHALPVQAVNTFPDWARAITAASGRVVRSETSVRLHRSTACRVCPGPRPAPRGGCAMMSCR